MGPRVNWVVWGDWGSPRSGLDLVEFRDMKTTWRCMQTPPIVPLGSFSRRLDRRYIHIQVLCSSHELVIKLSEVLIHAIVLTIWHVCECHPSSLPFFRTAWLEPLSVLFYSRHESVIKSSEVPILTIVFLTTRCACEHYLLSQSVCLSDTLALSYPELYLNPQGTPKSFPSHICIIPELSPNTPKYSQVFPSFPS